MGGCEGRLSRVDRGTKTGLQWNMLGRPRSLHTRSRHQLWNGPGLGNWQGIDFFGSQPAELVLSGWSLEMDGIALAVMTFVINYAANLCCLFLMGPAIGVVSGLVNTRYRGYAPGLPWPHIGRLKRFGDGAVRLGQRPLGPAVDVSPQRHGIGRLGPGIHRHAGSTARRGVFSGSRECLLSGWHV